MSQPAPERNRGCFPPERNDRELRVLLLIVFLAEIPDGPGHVDDLELLAALDFLLPRPRLAAQVLDGLDPDDPRLRSEGVGPPCAEAPEPEERRGPRDEPYYAVAGSLLGRGLLVRDGGDRFRVVLRPSARGVEVARSAANTPGWSAVSGRCRALAWAACGLSGNRVTELVEQRRHRTRNTISEG